MLNIVVKHGMQNLSMFGALLFFLGMKNFASKKSKKKAVKAKVN